MPATEIKRSMVDGLGFFQPNRRYVLSVITTGSQRQVGFVEWPVSGVLARDAAGEVEVIPVSADGMHLGAAALSGVPQTAAALTVPAQAAITNNIGGSVLPTLPAIPGAVYATDSATIKNSLSTLTASANGTAARLEDLITKLRAAGVVA